MTDGLTTLQTLSNLYLIAPFLLVYKNAVWMPSPVVVCLPKLCVLMAGQSSYATPDEVLTWHSDKHNAVLEG